ncbi:MAG: AAA family ATPase [Flavobacteriaceae bacterium]|nr:AAA family ATPase [Flavobacteriaceae bacterium]
MKIKSVKISGFRAFEKEENSTFDFTTNGEIMDFASIYAPNGFGKTSFYDAVEWGITHKIQRFDRMVDFDKVRKDNDAPLLLNKASLSGKVTVETSLNNFENVINKKKVYKFNEKPINEYFQNQILTQDLIDTFLKEEKADKRYENFLEVDDDLKKHDSTYKKIIRLLEYIKDERRSLEAKKSEQEKLLQSEIDFDQEFQKFDEINQVIGFLKKVNENIDYIDQTSFNQTTYENLSRNIDVRLVNFDEELIKAKLRIDTIILARDGENSSDSAMNGGILSYLNNRTKISNFEQQYKQLVLIVQWYEQQEKIVNELNLNTEKLNIEQNRLEQHLNIEKHFESFLDIQNKIDQLDKDIIEIKNKSLIAEREKLDSEKEKSDAALKFIELSKSLEINQIKLSNIPNQNRVLEDNSKVILDTQKHIDRISKLITNEEIKLVDLKVILDQFRYYENRIIDDVGLLLEFVFFNEHQELVKSFIEESKILGNLESNLVDVQQKIDSQNYLNKELQEFVNAGLEIVNKSQSTDCPLCTQGYESFEKLSENILSNKLFDIQLKALLEAKIDSETELNNLKTKLNNDKEIIDKTFSSLKQPYLASQDQTQKTLNKLDLERKENLDTLNKSYSLIKEVDLFFGQHQNSNDLTIILLEDISVIEKQLVEVTKLSDVLISKISNVETLLKTYVENLKISESNLAKLQSSSDYIKIKEYFFKELNSITFDKTLLLEHKLAIQEFIAGLIVKKEDLTILFDELKFKLVNHTLTKTEYIEKTEEVTEAKNLILRTYESFENFIQSEFGIQINGKNKSQIEDDFLELLEKQKETKNLLEDKIEKYKVVRVLNNACVKATESKKVKDRIEEIKFSLKELRVAEDKLNKEKASLKTYLKKTIEAYFYTPLINAIYKKIDPHPDYKSIEFECDFAESKPRLQIYCWSSNEKGTKVRSVPSLYFSTAQINILSLSIFLARALKTKDDNGEPVDCIFIDDPIQSMDSINILSFIDLFRGITLTLGKQLIISTHEENFHLLLQNKIPSELFKSKFLEFETFGKLKKEF